MNAKPYRDRMQSFVQDPELKELELKYEPYLDIHQIDDLLEVCDIVQAAPGEPVTGKLIWHSDTDLPIELKKDILNLYNRHFLD